MLIEFLEDLFEAGDVRLSEFYCQRRRTGDKHR
jgi:hypothetical protein